MLVLTRKRNEMIRIGDDIVVTVLRTGRNLVQIGIDAPAAMNIVRGELVSFESDFETAQIPICSKAKFA